MDNEIKPAWKTTKQAIYNDAIYALSQKCEKAGDLNTMLYSILDIIVKSSNAVAGTLWFYDFYGSGRIEPKVVYGGNRNINIVSLDYGEGIIGKVIKENKGVLIEDCQKDESFYKQADDQTGFTTKTMICVPIGNETAFAGIQIINKQDGTLYDQKDFEFVKAIAQEASTLFYKMSDKLLFGDKGEKLVNKIDNFIHDNSKENILNELETGLKNKKYKSFTIKRILLHAARIIDLF